MDKVHLFLYGYHLIHENPVLFSMWNFYVSFITLFKSLFSVRRAGAVAPISK